MRLTHEEIRLIAFVVLGLFVGATVEHWRDIQRAKAEPPARLDGPRKPVGTRIGGSPVDSGRRSTGREKRPKLFLAARLHLATFRAPPSGGTEKVSDRRDTVFGKVENNQISR